jgi:hypothetical protein
MQTTKIKMYLNVRIMLIKKNGSEGVCKAVYLHPRGSQDTQRSWWLVSLQVKICRIQSCHGTTLRNRVVRLLDHTGTEVKRGYPSARWQETPSG